MLDLDQTIVHTPREAEGQQLLARYLDTGRVFVVGHHAELFCAPRTYLVQFFCDVFQKYHVLYCTAGDQQYGADVVRSLGKYMLSTPDLDERLQAWITECTDPR